MIIQTVTGAWTLALFAAAVVVARQVSATGTVRALNGLIHIDAFSALLLVLITLVGAGATVYSGAYLSRDAVRRRLPTAETVRFQAWFQPFLLTMVVAVLFDNLGYLWIAIEATTLVSAVLVGFYGRRTSLEAAWKYIILCSVGIAIAMLGLIMLYAAGIRAGLAPAQALSWTSLAGAASRLDPASVRMAFALILVGFGTKAGLAPMHTWLPDAYSQAPAPVAVLSGMLLNTAFYAIGRFHTIAVGALGPAFPRGLLLAFGLLSLGLAALFILVQRDFKRLLAYSSVEHMGLVCIGVGIGTPVALFGAALHLVAHGLIKPVLFFAAGNLGQRYHSHRIGRVTGALRAMPITGPVFVAGTLAITGAPPAALFLSEFCIIAGALQSGRPFVAAATLAGIAVAFAGMLLHLRTLALGDAPPGVTRGERFEPAHLPLLILLAIAVVLGIWRPQAIQTLLTQVATLLGGGLLP